MLHKVDSTGLFRLSADPHYLSLRGFPSSLTFFGGLFRQVMSSSISLEMLDTHKKVHFRGFTNEKKAELAKKNDRWSITESDGRSDPRSLKCDRQGLGADLSFCGEHDWS